MSAREIGPCERDVGAEANAGGFTLLVIARALDRIEARLSPSGLATSTGNSVIQWAADEIARLREERRAGELTHRDPLPEVPATRAAETVRIRVAVAIDRNGKWTAHAWGDKGGLIESESEIINVAQEMMGDGPGDAVRWVEADIPVPLPTSGEAIRGEVEG